MPDFSRTSAAAALAAAAIAASAPGASAGPEPGERTAGALPPGGFGNGIFQVYVTGRGSPGAGQFTVLTGERNPAGAGRDILYGQGVPGTSYLTVRDVDTGTDYVQGQMITHANEVSLDPSVAYVQTTATSATAYWRVDSDLDLEQTVAVTGTTAADSRVTVTMKIHDSRTDKHKYRIQYLWDTAVGGDDGPVVQLGTAGSSFRPFDPVTAVEQTFTRPTGDLAVVDKYGNAEAPTLAVAISGTGNPQAVPDTVQYVCVPSAVFAPLGGYVTDPSRDIAGPASDCRNSAGHADSGVLLLWSRDAAQDDATVAATLRMSPATPYPTTLKAGPLSLGSATATLTDTTTGRPLAGRRLVFSGGGTTRCTVVTDADGRATCGGLLGGLLGYDVDHAGGAVWGASHAHGGLL